VELPSDGAIAGAVADLNGNGYDDLVLAMRYNGTRTDLNAFIYYGGPDGLSEKRLVMIPAPAANSVAVGDFNGNGRVDLAFVSSGKLRVFYQTELGFERERFVDLEIEAKSLDARDLDGDGLADLYALGSDGMPRVYWGGPDGLAADQYSEVPVAAVSGGIGSERTEVGDQEDHLKDTEVLARIVDLRGTPHLFVPMQTVATLVPVDSERRFGEPVSLPCDAAVAVDTGDVNGDGREEIVIAARDMHEGKQCSWIYWDGSDGFSADRRTPLPTDRASDVAVGCLDPECGREAVVIAQDRSEVSFSVDSVVFEVGEDEQFSEPIRLPTHNARRALIGRFSGPGEPELVFVNHRARKVGGDIDPIIWFGDADGFSSDRYHRLKGRDCVDAVCVDLDDDGYADIVTANCSENAIHLDPGSFVFRGGPSGYPYEPDVVLPTTRAHGVCCGDINHNGYLDLILGGFANPELLVFHGGPDGFDTQNPQRIHMEIDGVVYDQTRWILLADLNNDGWLDLFVPHISSDRSFVLWGGPDGFDIERRHMLSAFHASCAQAADLTGNGWLDLIVGGHAPSLQGPHDSFVYIYWNGPDGLREDRRMQLPANGINALQLADLNNNGRLDLFLCNYHEGRVRDTDSYIYWGQEGGGFSASDRSRLFMHSASGCVLGDFNENGWVDMAVAYHKVNNDHLGYSAVWWNGPDGFRDQRVTHLPSEGPHGMVRLPTGNQADRGPEEYYVSEPYKLGAGRSIAGISWEADVPAKTWVRAQLRFAETLKELDVAPWQGPSQEKQWFGDGDSFEEPGPRGQWVQYRLALGATGGGRTPRVTEVTVSFQ